MADNRLDPDVHLLGYWGFDESLETDIAIDGATNYSPANLTVTSAVSVQTGRVGAAREFDGSSSFATVSSARLRLLGEITIIGWCKLDTYNGSGSLLRAIVSCNGPTTGDNLLYGLYVDSVGRLVYKHTASAGTAVVRTAAAVIRTNQFYCIALRRSTSGPNQNIEFFVDNMAVPVVDVTVNAVASALPIPPPVANVAAAFSAGRSTKEADSAFWDGLLDEVSVHDMARAYQPYLRATYYRLALRNTTSHLTSQDNVLAVSSADMLAGVRWWCYERDKDLYVIRESPLGFFGPDTRLTTPGGTSATTTTKPELIYDPVSDTLLVLFAAGNRIFKLTAQATDAPATINMPFTADAGSILKVLDNADGQSLGTGGGQRELQPEDITYVNRSPVKVFATDTPAYNLGQGGAAQPLRDLNNIPVPTINFLTSPSLGLGVVVGPHSTREGGYRIFKLSGGSNVLLGNATFMWKGSTYFLAITPTVGDIYYAEALYPNMKPSGTFSNAVAYRAINAVLTGSNYALGAESDGNDTLTAGTGGGQLSEFEGIVYVNRSPVKLSGQDAPAYLLGSGGGQHGKVSCGGTRRPGLTAIEIELS